MRRVLAVTALVFAVSLAGADDLPFVLIPGMPSAPALDGTLADPIWQQAAVLGAFVMLDGTAAPTQQTQVRLGHDAERLYLGVVCREDRLDRIQRSASARDGAVWSDDCIEVFIGGADPNTYYHLAFNSAGTVADEKCTGEGKDLGWKCDFRVTTGRREGAWTATASIPLQQVGLEPGRPARLNLCRSEVPHREASCWSATLRGFHQPSRFG
ncbi:MAG: carbohydrate-binding family 9-like protein, partial [Armatimonadia bacterium]